MNKDDLIVRKSFSISHNNGEMWAENLDSLFDFSDIVESKFTEDMDTVRRPSSPSILAINLNQTSVTKHLAAIIMKGLIDAGLSVRKVAFVGLDKDSLYNMKQLFKKYKVNFAYHYFDDFVKAKEWLIP